MPPHGARAVVTVGSRRTMRSSGASTTASKRASRLLTAPPTIRSSVSAGQRATNFVATAASVSPENAIVATAILSAMARSKDGTLSACEQRALLNTTSVASMASR